MKWTKIIKTGSNSDKYTDSVLIKKNILTYNFELERRKSKCK